MSKLEEKPVTSCPLLSSLIRRCPVLTLLPCRNYFCISDIYISSNFFLFFLTGVNAPYKTQFKKKIEFSPGPVLSINTLD